MLGIDFTDYAATNAFLAQGKYAGAATQTADETGAFTHWMGDLRKAAEEKYSALFKELSGGALGDDIEL